MNELNIQPKTPIGKGSYHVAFNFEHFKDKVIKTKRGNFKIGPDNKLSPVKNQGENLDIDEIETFIDNPDIFAKVYKYTDRYAIIEKLDTENFKRDLNNKIADAIVKAFINNPKLSSEFTLKKPRDLTAQDFDASVTLTIGFNNHPELIPLVLKFSSDRQFTSKFIKFLRIIERRADEQNWTSIDIHENNIGYDKEGNFKLLDF